MTSHFADVIAAASVVNSHAEGTTWPRQESQTSLPPEAVTGLQLTRGLPRNADLADCLPCSSSLDEDLQTGSAELRL